MIYGNKYLDNSIVDISDINRFIEMTFNNDKWLFQDYIVFESTIIISEGTTLDLIKSACGKFLTGIKQLIVMIKKYGKKLIEDIKTGFTRFISKFKIRKSVKDILYGEEAENALKNSYAEFEHFAEPLIIKKVDYFKMIDILEKSFNNNTSSLYVAKIFDFSEEKDTDNTRRSRDYYGNNFYNSDFGRMYTDSIYFLTDEKLDNIENIKDTMYPFCILHGSIVNKYFTKNSDSKTFKNELRELPNNADKIDCLEILRFDDVSSLVKYDEDEFPDRKASNTKKFISVIIDFVESVQRNLNYSQQNIENFEKELQKAPTMDNGKTKQIDDYYIHDELIVDTRLVTRYISICRMFINDYSSSATFFMNFSKSIIDKFISQEEDIKAKRLEKARDVVRQYKDSKENRQNQNAYTQIGMNK